MPINYEQISNNDLMEINKYTIRDVTIDEIYTFTVVLCDNEIDRDFERFSDEALEKLAKLYVGVTGIVDHDSKSKNQCARIFSCRVEVPEGKTTSDGKQYKRLCARAYLPKGEGSSGLILALDSGIKKEVYIGCAIKKRICSICGEDISSCGHFKGRKYAGRLCYATLEEPTDAYEWSIVFVQNIIKKNSRDGKQIKITTQLKIDNELKDVKIENGEITILETKKKTTGWEKDADKYSIDSTGQVFKCIENTNNLRYKNANIFSCKQIAENISRMQTLQRQIFKWQAENDEPVDLKTGCRLWTIINNEITGFYKANSSCKHVYGFLPCFSSEEKAKECIEVFKDELTWLFTEFQWRMDGN